MHEVVYIDTSIFIWSHNYPESNSTLILRLIARDHITGVISEKVLEELKTYFTRSCNEDVAFTILKFAELSFRVIPQIEIETEMNMWKGQIKDKDLEHIATV